jgi:hypothetical protein
MLMAEESFYPMGDSPRNIWLALRHLFRDDPERFRKENAESTAFSAEPEMKNKPNNAMEPTPVNVTIPASTGLAPFTSVVVAHL